MTEKPKLVLERAKCWSPFPTMFSKGFCLAVIKSRDCMGQSKEAFELSSAKSKLFHDDEHKNSLI